MPIGLLDTLYFCDRISPVELTPLWKKIDQIKSIGIPNNCDYELFE
jgi:hypothetical protein